VRVCKSTLSLQQPSVVAAYLPVQRVSPGQDIQELMLYKGYKWWKMRYSARLQSSTWRVVYLLYVLGRWFSEKAFYLEYKLFRKLIHINQNFVFPESGPGKRSTYSNSLGAGRSVNQIPVGEGRGFAPVLTGPEPTQPSIQGVPSPGATTAGWWH
jgi:hypothetical protein